MNIMWLFKKKTTEEKIQELEEQIAYMEEEYRLWNLAFRNNSVPMYKVEQVIRRGAELEQLKCKLNHLKTNPQYTHDS